MPSVTGIAMEPVRRRAARAWNAFWFTPRDPTLLGLMRICGGAITFYTLLMYSFTLMDFVGPHAWVDQKAILEVIHKRPIQAYPLSGSSGPRWQAPATPFQKEYADHYFKRWGDWPLPPYPESETEAAYCDEYRTRFGIELRSFGLPPPKNDKEWRYVLGYTMRWGAAMPPPYPEDDAEAAEITKYIERFNVDPRRTYARGMTTFSIWLHVTDPFWMGVVHAVFVGAALLFTLGIGTRVTSFLTWFAVLNYIHRDNVILFGVDTMMTILVLYLAIGPSGAALSVDRLLSRWWKGRRAGGGLAPWEPPQASIVANVAVRLLQIHVCIIYCMAGLAKLEGAAWWNGTALWNVLANFEFAPMNWHVYNWILRALGNNQLVFEIIMNGGVYFTLAFELLYAVWIWRPTTRWVILTAAIILHGVIGLFMGLQTFALIMLVLNMAFLRTEEVYWILAEFGLPVPTPKKIPVPAEPREAEKPGRALPAPISSSTHVTVQK